MATQTTHQPRLRLTCPPRTRIPPTSRRALHRPTSALYARKNAQDREEMDTTSTEYSQSGGNDDAAAREKAAFDPKKSGTSPEEEEEMSREESGGDESSNPLNVSPANQEINQPRNTTEGGAQGSPRSKMSGGGSAPKAGGKKSG
ncbi:hypothetical protein BDY21DRAFT_293892 [Lineolata rhizophorae]|uniref:Uncharacterized protein n=1 Tax=Lineolata rhizophorae TaxID=578093 RepID=A0A6A6NMK9_9PEZI|nr:hypothetical protein BDY21DRAFT_293892 [Lineolata rhizophorae]